MRRGGTMWIWLWPACFVISPADEVLHDRGLHVRGPDGPEGVHLTLIGDGFDAYDAYPILAVAIDGTDIVTSGDDTVRKGQFEITFADRLEPDVKYKVDVLIDTDGDYACTDGYTSSYTDEIDDALFRIKAISTDHPGPLEIELFDDDVDDVACRSFP
jgi:hypothetical protein